MVIRADLNILLRLRNWKVLEAKNLRRESKLKTTSLKMQEHKEMLNMLNDKLKMLKEELIER
jgi:hypothetical protein